MVVFVKYAMADDGRRGKSGGGKGGIFRRMFGGSPWSNPSVGSHRHSNLSLAPTSPPHERRPLRSVPTVGSHFKVDPEVLARDYVEKETKYVGTVSDVPLDFDPGNRVMVLSLLDEKKKLGFIPYRLTWRHDVVISFCVYNVKISSRDGEELIHRIPTHQIAATGFVQDDNQIYLFIKFASEVNSEMCNLAFFSCESKTVAQEICYLTQQLFQLAYTNSTMEFFDKSIRDGAVTPKHHSLSTDGSAEKKESAKTQHYQASSASDSVEISTVILNGHPDVLSPPRQKSSTLPLTSSSQQHPPNRGPVTSSSPSTPITKRNSWRSESNNSSTTSTNPNHQQFELQEYIGVLRERLTQEELQKFAEHLHHFRKGTLPIKIFCERLLAIYSEQRKSLLLGMRHFIPEKKDRTYFENFLKRHNIETGSDDVRWWDRPPTSRTLSETEGSCASTTIHVNELSSNSDHVSPSHTSNEDSGEWKLVVEKMKTLKSDEDLPSTLKRKSNEQETIKTLVSSAQTGADDATKRDVETSSRIPNVVLNLSEWDSPVLRSGQNDGDQEPVFPHRRETKPIKKKKSRGKSPSAAELGAPYPSFMTGGTDDDLESNIDKKSKKALKYKRKEKIRNGNENKDAQPSNVSEDRDKRTKSVEDLTISDTEKGGNSKKKFFKAVKAKDKKETSVPSTPDQPPSDTILPVVWSKPPRKEHRKKRKHKSPDEPPTPTSTAF